MRSCSKVDSCFLTAVDTGLLAISEYSMPRSMRLTADKPHRWAISVALLDQGEKGITEIAVEVGFSSSSYFTRVFNQEVGVSPRAYVQSRCVDHTE